MKVTASDGSVLLHGDFNYEVYGIPFYVTGEIKVSVADAENMHADLPAAIKQAREGDKRREEIARLTRQQEEIKTRLAELCGVKRPFPASTVTTP